MPEVLARLPFATESLLDFMYELEGYFAQIAFLGKHKDKKFIKERKKEIQNDYRSILSAAYNPGWDINSDIICDAIDEFENMDTADNSESIKERSLYAHQILNDDLSLMDIEELEERYA